ncbi:MAG: hypothetical protein R3B06_27180 [Kofleriaceae bacterium]
MRQRHQGHGRHLGHLHHQRRLCDQRRLLRRHVDDLLAGLIRPRATSAADAATTHDAESSDGLGGVAFGAAWAGTDEPSSIDAAALGHPRRVIDGARGAAVPCTKAVPKPAAVPKGPCMIFCPSCGVDRRAVAPVAPCPSCGVAVDLDRLTRGASRTAPAPVSRGLAADDDDLEALAAPGRSARRAVGIGLAAVAVVGAVIAVATCGRDKPRATSTKALAASLAQGATPVAEPPPPAMPTRIVLRVERVQVAVDGREWDGPVAERDYKQGCKDVSALTVLLAPAAARLIRLGCALMSDQRQRQTDPREPDLRLELRSGGVTYTSYVAPDRRAHQFGYSFVVPDESIPAQGLVLAVVDNDDGASGGQEIGSVRLSRDQLIGLATTGEVRALRAGALELLEVTVAPHDGRLRKVEADLAVRDGGATVEGIQVNAGDVVRIETSGTWQIGTRGHDELGPEGFTDGRLHDHNLPLFKHAAHGGTVALVGQQGQQHVLAVSPCARFVSPYAGVVWVGVNDRAFADNRGTVHLRVFTRGAKPGEWRTPGATLACD